MADSSDRTHERLQRWYGGDPTALEELLREHIEWMRRYVRRNLNPALRSKFDSLDVVQDAVVRILKYGPQVQAEDGDRFRNLIGRILVTTFRDRLRNLRAGRRDIGREAQVSTMGFVAYEDGSDSDAGPVADAERKEMEDWVRLAIEFLDHGDRQVIRLRQFDQLPFEVVAERMGLPSPDAARMRFQRALPRLANRVRELVRAARPLLDGK